METIIIAFITAFVTILLNHIFEVYRKELTQRRELHIKFYSKIKKAESEIYALILRGNYGWGNTDDYNFRIEKAQLVYEKLLNDFYEQLLLNDIERRMTKEVIFSYWENIIINIIVSETDGNKRKTAMKYYETELQEKTEELRKLYLKNSTTIISKIIDYCRRKLV